MTSVCSVHREVEPCIFCKLDYLRLLTARGDNSRRPEYDALVKEVLKRPIQ